MNTPLSPYGDSSPDAKTQFLQACAVKTVGRANIACDEQGSPIRKPPVTVVRRISSPYQGEMPSLRGREGTKRRNPHGH